ncbi:MAG TPA: hypothetical protein VNO24_29200, partial [Blastocatellia bacterium]|nr:hypothetical protein [Blastocatellia bacterium]
MRARLLIVVVFLLVSVAPTLGQTTAFTYQGKLTDGANPANGNYDFEFKLFDGVSGGIQQGSTVQLLNVAVTSGIFTVQLDFGNPFTGDRRFLDISVRQAGGGAFTPLTPRQQVTSNPYAIKSLNSLTADGLSLACVNCVTSSQIAGVNGSAVIGQIPVASVPAGSANYIQNATAQQGSSNFNISGDGTAGGTLSANAVNATTQYNIGGLRALSANGSFNFFAGLSAGRDNTTGSSNSFFGISSGEQNTTGFNNTYFGALAGRVNTTATFNSFFGSGAGSNNTASQNSFFGGGAGFANTTGGGNSFFGASAGSSNTTGDSNAFFGNTAGQFNTTTRANSFFGANAGRNNTANDNAFFGTSAGLNNTT